MDIGAGQGLFSLAAAARGHRVLAAEMSAKSVASMNASIQFNGFQDLVAVRQVQKQPQTQAPQSMHVTACM